MISTCEHLRKQCSQLYLKIAAFSVKVELKKYGRRRMAFYVTLWLRIKCTLFEPEVQFQHLKRSGFEFQSVDLVALL